MIPHFLFGLDAWRVLAAFAVSLGYLIVCARLYCRFHPGSLNCQSFMPTARRGEKQPAVCLVYASQTGQAQSLAEQAASALSSGDVPVRLFRFEQDWMTEAARSASLLFVVSTSGAGDPPDHAAGMWRRLVGMAESGAMMGVPYGVLALGDRNYADFCGFGRKLDQALSALGGQALFERIELDRLDADGIAQWQARLTALGVQGRAAGASRAIPDEGWYFLGRQHLNEGSSGSAMCLVRLSPAHGPAHWQAGDLLDILIPGGDGHPRSYSIANAGAEGMLELIVRTHLRDDGSPGEASSWLNDRARSGDQLLARVRRNPSFNLDAPPDTPLILIGAGSGLAGLRAHLQARGRKIADSGRAAPALSAWLIYGERSEAQDSLCRDEFDAWLQSGLLTRLDRVFSRDTPEAPYVQHRLQAERERLERWVDAGAVLLICGSAVGMATGVDEALRALLGTERVDQLVEAGRIRRDVF